MNFDKNKCYNELDKTVFVQKYILRRRKWLGEF